ncbi:hypothetical protein VST7929_01431 [Vibrio stylophorae]|uniref:Metal ion permease n=1 Tax=Vibrio stylophorae TaxID=659351 RepID=A0ABM8ZTB1_9VIBR|nr:permease [Vibrio stylophorae]CAH0533561.1 hypothetical protein VST7929_01431 [Vibrio stylophorae]
MFADAFSWAVHYLDVLTHMVWQIYWPLAFGLMLSAFIRHVLPVSAVSQHLGQTSVKSVSLSTLLGMVSSSCSYAAASLSHTLLSKKSTLANAMVFLVASTNLIVEMFIVLVALLGWTFLWGEVLGGLLLITIVALLFSRFYPKPVEQTLRQRLAQEDSSISQQHSEHHMADCGMDMSAHQKDTMDDCGMDMSAHQKDTMDDCGMDMSTHQKNTMDDCGMDMSAHQKDTMDDCGMDMSAHQKDTMDDCGMDMSAHKHAMDTHQSSMTQKPSKVGQAASYFQMDIQMIGKEILIGVLVSSLLISIVPLEGWRALFIPPSVNMPFWLHSFFDVIIGVFVAVIAYVCSVGNLLLAAALWHGGISFGGVIGFILADVLTIPMMRVYQKYYGTEATKWMVALLFCAIVATGLLIDVIFTSFGVSVSSETLRPLIQDGFGWNTTTVMNLIFIPLSIWFYRRGATMNQHMSM